MSGCKCFEENLERIKAKVMEGVPKDAKDIKAEWQNHSFFLGGGDYSPVNPRVQFEYRAPKRGGGHAKNLTRDSVTIVGNYCPFCGRKLQKDGEV